MPMADAIRSAVDVESDEAVAETHRPQIILTTHNPGFLDCFNGHVCNVTSPRRQLSHNYIG